MPYALLTAVVRLRPFALCAGLLTALAFPAQAGTLPAPFVSRSLDAVLIPVDASVQSAFGLAGDEKGVLVLAVEAGGIADAAGIAPGDVIGMASGRAITDPIMVDEIVYYWIQKGTFDFGFDGWHAGSAKTYATNITQESYSTIIDVTSVSTWSSYSYENFSYAEYTAEYSSGISQSYESSETMIEETASSEEFAAEETVTEQTATDETATQDAMADDQTDPNLDTDADGTPDMSDTDDDNDGIADEADTDDNGDGTSDADE